MSALPVIICRFPLGSRAELRVSLDKFNGDPRLDLRTWCDMEPSGIRGPTRRGVSLSVSQIPALMAALGDALARANALGLLEKGGGGAV